MVVGLNWTITNLCRQASESKDPTPIAGYLAELMTTCSAISSKSGHQAQGQLASSFTISHK